MHIYILLKKKYSIKSTHSEILGCSVNFQWGLLISFNCFGVNWIHKRYTRGATRTRAPSQGWFYKWRLQTCSPPSSLARVSVASGSVRGPHEARSHSAAPIRMLCQYKPWLEGMLYCLLQCLTSRVIPGDRFLFGRWAGLEACPLVGLVGMKLVHLQSEPSLVQCLLCFSWRTKMHGLVWWKCARKFLSMKGLIPLTVSHTRLT